MNISIIIPVYNTKEEYLTSCLESVLHQDFEDFEVIAVNDGSTNGCEKLLESYGEKYPNMVYINQENAGTSVARNTGLSRAKGDYILFVDADDYLSTGALRTVYEAMKRNDTDILFFGYATNYTNREMRRVLKDPDPGLFERETLELAVLKGDKRLGPVEVGAPWGKLIKHDVIRDNNLRYTPGLIKGQDTVFILSLLDHCSSFSYLSYLGYHYRISGSSVSRRYNPDIVSIMEKTLNAYREFVETRGKGQEFKDAVNRKYLNILLGEYLELFFLHPDAGEDTGKRRRDYALLSEREPYRTVIKEAKTPGMGFFMKNETKFLKEKKYKSLFLLKKAELTIRNIVIHKFG